LLESPNLAPYNKLEYLERELEELREEEKHLKWLKAIPAEQREWLIHQDIDRLLQMNTRIQTQARTYVKRCYVDIRNNIESMDFEDVDIKTRYESLIESEKNEEETGRKQE
jgi:hypothetical protein